MTELKTFFHPDIGTVRVVLRNGEPWFVGRDITKAIGLLFHKEVIDGVCKNAYRLTDEEARGLDGVHRGTVVIPESDVYRIAMRSACLKAEKVQDWVCEEILPSIRRRHPANLLDFLPDDAAEVLERQTEKAAQEFAKKVCEFLPDAAIEEECRRAGLRKARAHRRHGRNVGADEAAQECRPPREIMPGFFDNLSRAIDDYNRRAQRKSS